MPDLNVLRISRDTESSSALDRQRAQLEAYDAQNNRGVVAWVEDATVSGSVNLDQRKSLGRYMIPPLVGTWDTLKVTTQDRITRDDMHWWSFVGWLMENDKSVIVLDDPALDLTTPTGRAIAGIKAMQAAEYRLQVVKKRNDQLAYYRDYDLWPGGNWPFGYRAVKDKPDPLDNNKIRYRLIPDPITMPMVREAYQRIVFEGDSKAEVVRDWNRRELMTALDHQRHINALNGREGVKTTVRGTKWHTTTLTTILTSPSLMGYATQNGKMRLRDGLPVQWAEPILKPHEFKLLQEAMEKRSAPLRGPRPSADELLGVLFCECNEIMHANSARRQLADGTKKKYLYYVCSSASKMAQEGIPACQWKVSWNRDFLRQELEDFFLSTIGPLEVMSRVFIPGHDRSNEILELKEAIKNLTTAISVAKSPAAIEALTRTMEEHSEALAALEGESVVPPTWEESGTGKTFAELWEEQGWAERGKTLRNAGIRLYVGGKPTAPDLHLYTPEDLQRRIQDAVVGSLEPGYIEKRSAEVDQLRAT